MRQKGIASILVIVLVLLLGAGAFYYFNFKNKIVVSISPKPTPTVSPSGTFVNPSKTPNPNANTYTSESLGIEFDYATYLDDEKTVKTLIKEEGNKIYVYASTLQKPSQGQFIEVFNNENKDSLASAIEKRFLGNISKDDCFVTSKPDSDNPNIIQATISYPWPNQDEPKFMFGEKCPEDYKETNGIRFFEMDVTHPSTYIFLSIGQQPGPSSTNLSHSPEWFKSIRFLK